MKDNRITLYYKEGSSDKVYSCAMESKGDLWVVNYAYGRRGAAMTTGTKTQMPVPKEKAIKIMSLLVAEKQGKGYTIDTSGKAFMHTDKEQTGIYPHLLIPITEEVAKILLADDNYYLQEKYDGHRKMVNVTSKGITGINRKGLTVSLPAEVITAAESIETEVILDGEQVGDVQYVFDLVDKIKTFEERYNKLMQLIPKSRYMKIVSLAKDTVAKRTLYNSLLKANREGVVFKHKDSLYVPGKTKGAHAQFKYKFYETASVIVTGTNDKASVKIGVMSGSGDLIPVGNVTIPPNHKTPLTGTVIEIRYLYAFPGGSIYQPVYLGQRSDIDSDECTADQLKFKEG